MRKCKWKCLQRRVNRPPLPSIILCNARSLQGKMEELRVNSKACFEYRTSSLMVLTETWLHQDFPDAAVELDAFLLVQVDRNAQSGKNRGGGLVVYVSNAWCKQYTIKETMCCPDVEILFENETFLPPEGVWLRCCLCCLCPF